MKSLFLVYTIIFVAHTEIVTAKGCSYKIGNEIRYGRECDKKDKEIYLITKCDPKLPLCNYKGKVNVADRPCNDSIGPGFAQAKNVGDIVATYGCKKTETPASVEIVAGQLTVVAKGKEEQTEFSELIKDSCAVKNFNQGKVDSILFRENNRSVKLFRIDKSQVKEEVIQNCK